MWREWGTGEVHIGFSWGDLMEIDHLEDLGLERRIILKWIFNIWNGEAWTGLLWLRIETGDGRL
jgi:hypothetical protein